MSENVVQVDIGGKKLDMDSGTAAILSNYLEKKDAKYQELQDSYDALVSSTKEDMDKDKKKKYTFDGKEYDTYDGMMKAVNDMKDKYHKMSGDNKDMKKKCDSLESELAKIKEDHDRQELMKLVGDNYDKTKLDDLTIDQFKQGVLVANGMSEDAVTKMDSIALDGAIEFVKSQKRNKVDRQAQYQQRESDFLTMFNRKSDRGNSRAKHDRASDDVVTMDHIYGGGK